MRGFLFFGALCAVSVPTFAGDVNPDKIEKLDSVIVSASRAGENTPVTFTNLNKEELRKVNPMNSLVQALSLQPSVVTSLEGGTGLGYSKMTVRGVKGSQINVTLNGITLNDAESQEVFWVNIPALTSLINSVQLQRGLGTSSNGPGAFGASINMSTASVGTSPFGYVNVAAGSYNTMTMTASAGTGLTKSGLYFSAAYSKDYTDGYIRNAKAKVQSAFAALGWLKGNNSLKLTYLMGDQHSGITWNGIDPQMYKTNRKYNSTGEFYDADGAVHYYDNDTDNYTQHHIQLNYTHEFANSLTWSTTFNYTRGDGYYENYKAGKKFSKYRLPDFTDEDGNVHQKSDFIVRKDMGNDYYVLNSNLTYKSEKLDVTGGVYASRYDGDHFGKVIWSSVMGDAFDYDAYNNTRAWYSHRGLKQELNAFVRAEYRPLEWLTAYADLQYRGVFLDMSGEDDDYFESLAYKHSWNFFNPRVGLTFAWAPQHKAYVSAALGNREPGKSDLQEQILTMNKEISLGNKGEVTLKPEQMLDIELGYSFTGEKVAASANLYMMEYWNMLLETGKLSNVGYAIKENVPRAWRRGVELAAAYSPADGLTIEANATLSMNQIHNYTLFCTEYDSEETWKYVGTYSKNFGTVTMRMSPSVLGMARISWSPFKPFAGGSLKTTTLSIDGKYIGSQYWDNTECNDRKAPAYFVSDLMLSHEFNVGSGKLGLRAYVNNLFNKKYYSDVAGELCFFQKENKLAQSWASLFPQSEINFIFGLTYSF